MAENRVIGRDNQLPWHLPADMRHFKTLTMGHTLILGRKTFEAVGKPLPGRRMIVLTRDRSWSRAGIDVSGELDHAIALCAGEPEVFVAGGAEVYRAALPRADRIYLTLVHATVEGDALFPEFSASEWSLISDQSHPADDRNRFAMSFRRYERIQLPKGSRDKSTKTIA